MKKELTLDNIHEHPFFSNQEFIDAFNDFLSLRKRMRKPVTDRAYWLLIKKLDQLGKGDVNIVIKIIDQSIEHGWQGFFPLRGV